MLIALIVVGSILVYAIGGGVTCYLVERLDGGGALDGIAIPVSLLWPLVLVALIGVGSYHVTKTQCMLSAERKRLPKATVVSK